MGKNTLAVTFYCCFFKFFVLAFISLSFISVVSFTLFSFYVSLSHENNFKFKLFITFLPFDTLLYFYFSLLAIWSKKLISVPFTKLDLLWYCRSLFNLLYCLQQIRLTTLSSHCIWCVAASFLLNASNLRFPFMWILCLYNIFCSVALYLFC